MPGFRADSTISFAAYEISPDDARDAARRGVTVVTTLAGAGTSGSMRYQERFRELHRKNLTLLRESGVRIAIGSDAYRQTSVDEALYVSSLGVFTNAELLNMWCVNTAWTIFPRRRIGRLQEGSEASFLALTDDPLRDFANTQKIALRVKQGVILQADR
jgi:imidazolonepropionase-like amidohydrolase